MPYSFPTFDARITKWLRSQKRKNYLDIGVGSGKYGQIIRGLYPKADIVGIESEKEYSERFGLNKIYSSIYVGKAEYFFDQNPNFVTEIAIIGDCLEHVKKSDGVDLVHDLVHRSHYIVIVWPSKYVQLVWEGHASEVHRSVWTKKDFADFDHEYWEKDGTNLVIMKGLWEDPQTRMTAEGLACKV